MWPNISVSAFVGNCSSNAFTKNLSLVSIATKEKQSTTPSRTQKPWVKFIIFDSNLQVPKRSIIFVAHPPFSQFNEFLVAHQHTKVTSSVPPRIIMICCHDIFNKWPIHVGHVISRLWQCKIIAMRYVNITYDFIIMLFGAPEVYLFRSWWVKRCETSQISTLAQKPCSQLYFL